MDLHAVTLCECCYFDGIDRKYCSISLKIYRMYVCVCVFIVGVKIEITECF